MSLEKTLAKIFNLNEQNWLKHSNPVSVYTRYLVLPFLSAPIYFRYELGNIWWVFFVLAILWMFINPVLFPKPKSTKNWASRCVLGERVYAKRKELNLPEHHQSPIFVLSNLLAFIGFVLTFYAAYYDEGKLMILSILLASLAKTWFLDRMVWLYLECKHLDPEFESWDY